MIVCCGQIAEVASHSNEAIRARENAEQIMKLEENFMTHPKFMANGRVFVRQGPLIKKCRAADKKFEFFLFNNMLAYASKAGWKFKLHRKIDIDGAFMVDGQHSHSLLCYSVLLIVDC